MTKNARTRRDLSTAYHEAGHAVVAMHLGIGIKVVSIRPDADSAGHCDYVRSIRGPIDFSDPSPSQERRLHYKMIAGLSGGLAQRRFAPRGFRWHHARYDNAQIARLIASLIYNDAVSETLYRYLLAQAKVIVDFRWRDVAVVAGELIQRREMKGDEVRNVVLAQSLT